MLEAYRDLFHTYLKVLKKAYDPKKPYENLEECVSMCEHFFWKLHGMIDLLSEIKCINEEIESLETERIAKVFSTIRLFGAQEEDGEILICKKKESTMPEDPYSF